MYSYFLSDYINNILCKDTRKLKDLSKGEMVQLVILISFSFLVLVATILYQINKTIGYIFLSYLLLCLCIL